MQERMFLQELEKLREETKQLQEQLIQVHNVPGTTARSTLCFTWSCRALRPLRNVPSIVDMHICILTNIEPCNLTVPQLKAARAERERQQEVLAIAKLRATMEQMRQMDAVTQAAEAQASVVVQVTFYNTLTTK